VKQTRPRFRMFARLAAAKRRRRGVECTAGLSSESNGFFLFRKRNPLEPSLLNEEQPSPPASPEAEAAPVVAAEERPGNPSPGNT
jgi:hypothetical protein